MTNYYKQYRIITPYAQFKALTERDWKFLSDIGCGKWAWGGGYGKDQRCMLDVKNQKLMIKRGLTKIGLECWSVMYDNHH